MCCILEDVSGTGDIISVNVLYIRVKSAEHVGLYFLVKLPQKGGCVNYTVT